MRWRPLSIVVTAVGLLGTTVFAAPATAQPSSGTVAPVELQPRKAPRPTSIAGTASGPTAAGRSDCATVRATVKTAPKQLVSCVTVTDEPAKSAVAGGTVGTSAVWCDTLTANMWWITRSGACFRARTFNYTLMEDDTVVGTARIVISQQINLLNDSSVFGEHVEATMTEATGVISELAITFIGSCSDPCATLGGGRAFSGDRMLLGQRLDGTVRYSTLPDPASVPVTTRTSYQLTIEAPISTIASTISPLATVAFFGPNPIRCDAHVGSNSGCVIPDYTPFLELFLSVHRESAAMILISQLYLPDKWGAEWLGGPPVHRLADPTAQDRNRTRICGDGTFVPLPIVRDDSCDEFSFAATYESGGMFDLRGRDCAEIRPFQDPTDGGWYAELIRFTGQERCMIGHVPLDFNRMVGTDLANFTMAQRLLDADAYYIDVYS
jgi:hypothetical protein